MCEPNEPPGKQHAGDGMWATVQAAVREGWSATLRLSLILTILLILILALNAAGAATIVAIMGLST